MSELTPLNETGAKFVENEKILCYQGPLLYEAKVLKVDLEESDGVYLYMVHYAGWNKKYDEWVAEVRCMKYTLQNLEKQKEILQQVKNQNRSKRIKLKNNTNNQKLKGERQSKSPESSQSKSDESLPENSSDLFMKRATNIEKPSVAVEVENEHIEETIIEKKTSSPVKKQEEQHKDEEHQKSPQKQTELQQSEQRYHQQQLKQCQQKTQKKQLRSKRQRIQEQVEKKGQPIILPSLLKSLLGDDHVLVNQDKMLLKLPADITVEKIMHMYTNEKELHKEENCEWKKLKEDIDGLKELFNVVLGNKLLYKFERVQYGEMIKSFSGLSPCQIYGLPHLVRFFTQIESSMTKYKIRNEDVKQSRMVCNDVISYVTANFQQLFTVDDYFYASTEYCKKTIT